MTRELENKFFREFQHDGAATMSLHMMHWEYCGIGNHLPVRGDYPDGVLAEIRQRTENFNIWPWGGEENLSPLMDEITDNFALRQPDTRVAYAEEILMKMQNWAWLYSLSKEKLDAVSNSIRLHSIEHFFFTWRNAFRTFAKRLAVILAKLGISILEVQNQCGIYIIDNLDIKRLWNYFGTPESAEYYLSKLNIPDSKKRKVTKRKAGRPKGEENDFFNLLIGSKEEREATLSILHNHLDGKQGKYVALTIQACVASNKLIKPSFEEIKSEFDIKGTKQAFNNYYGDFRGTELELMKKNFEIS